MNVINSCPRAFSDSQSSNDSEEGLLHVKRIILFPFRIAHCKDIENKQFICQMKDHHSVNQTMIILIYKIND